MGPPSSALLQRHIAIQRGPIVYCLEGVDHGAIVLDRIAIDPKHVLSNEFGIEYQDDLLGGVSIIRGKGDVVDENGWEGKLYQHREPASKYMDIMAIPYYAWDNRASGEMRVWIPER